MKTEILFRAWVETYEGKEMINNYCSMNNDENHFYATDLTNERPGVGEVISVMQFTGNPDINGKKIFESDICKIIWPDGTIKFAKIVKKVDFFAPDYSSMPISVLMKIGITFEVIGNVFDDSELIIERDE